MLPVVCLVVSFALRLTRGKALGLQTQIRAERRAFHDESHKYL
ncbi:MULTISPECIES: hypothetical protein [unclassified Ensifer]|nr:MULTISPECIES: hypothetical protein [unclassified Ensifer]